MSTTSTTTPPLTEWVVVGNGESEHVPVLPTDEVTMHHGGQGGWHIEVSGEVVGTASLITLQVWVESVADGSTVAGSDQATFLQLADFDEAVPSGIFVGQNAYLGVGCVDDEKICGLGGQAIRLCALAADVAAPELLAEGCSEAIAVIDPIDTTLCDAVADGSWYPGWPGTPTDC
jgi:hypothetical protein